MKTAKKTIVIFAGTRPEIIKMASLVRELRQRASQSPDFAFNVHFCFSGQHLELALPFLKFFQIEPDSTLELMIPGQSLAQLTARASAQIDSFFASFSEKYQSDIAAVLVQGDTTTAFVASLVAFYHKIPVGHVEAGLRTKDISEPFPEELNRRLITRTAEWHFAPTSVSEQALLNEGIAPSQILTCGNTGIDSLQWVLQQNLEPQNQVLKKLLGQKLVLVTAHRRENIGKPLENIAQALKKIAQQFSQYQFILPLHKNPRVVEILEPALANLNNFHLVEPLEYQDLVWAMKNCTLIMSDSGGIQEEAPVLKKPVLVLRNETERPEAVSYGTSILVGSNPAKIFEWASGFLTGSKTLNITATTSPYGSGDSALQIIDYLTNRLIKK